MIDRFKQITDNVYRGSAPSVLDVIRLNNQFGINNIISLDQESGEKIKNICKKLNINHNIIHLDGKRKTVLNLLKYNLKDLVFKNKPTYIHCLYGKDRTGFFAALIECLFLNKLPDKAISDAKKLDFGKGCSPGYTNLFEKIIHNCKPLNDENNASIVDNTREYISDYRSSYLQEANRSSFAPHLDSTKQFPYDIVYNPINDQSPTRDTKENCNTSIKEHKDNIPLVGIYNNDAGVRGFGPSENLGGFIYD